MSTVTAKCSCGSEKFEMPSNPRATDRIKCSKCGATGRYGDVMKAATTQAKQAIEKQLKDALKRAGFK